MVNFGIFARMPCENDEKQISWAIICVRWDEVSARLCMHEMKRRKRQQQKKIWCYSLEFACDNVTVLYFSSWHRCVKTMDNVPLAMKKWTNTAYFILILIEIYQDQVTRSYSPNGMIFFMRFFFMLFLYSCIICTCEIPFDTYDSSANE